MRTDFPRAAKKKFGAKTLEVVEMLTQLYEETAAMFDLSGNTVKNHVKTGGTEQTGQEYICRYISYKNGENVGTQLTVTQLTAASELEVTVEYYQTNAGAENFRRPERFAIGEFDRAAALYRSNLLEVGVAPRQSAAA
jgi:hypothetical protein